MVWCLEKSLADKFRHMIKTGKISPEQLKSFENSKARRAFFAEHFGEENAKAMNTALEAKSLLKNQEQGVITWAKQFGGMKPEAQRDMLSRVQRMGRMLERPEDFADLIDRKLGVAPTQGEAATITDLAAKAQESKTTMEAGPRTAPGASPNDTERAFGAADYDFQQYVAKLKAQAKKRSLAERGAAFRREPVMEIVRTGRDILTGVGGTAKAVKSVFDDSATFMQNFLTFFKGVAETAEYPLRRKAPLSMVNWAKSFRDSLWAIGQGLQNKDIAREIHIRFASDVLAPKMKKASLDLATIEEELPVQWPGKIPVIGRLYKAGQGAFNATVWSSRYYNFTMQHEIYDKTGGDVTSKAALNDLGKIINAATGRGYIRSSKTPGVINATIYGPRLFKSQWDNLTGHTFGLGLETKQGRRLAAENVIQPIIGAGIILAITKLFNDDAVTFEPTEPDFGKIKMGNQRIRLLPYTPLIVLAARAGVAIYDTIQHMATGQEKKFKYGEHTALDSLWDFIQNKASPAASVVATMLEGKDRWTGKQPTVGSLTRQSVSPFGAENVLEQVQDLDTPDTKMNAANFVLGILTEGLGLSTMTYSQYEGFTQKDIAEFSAKGSDEIKNKVNSAWNRGLVTPQFREWLDTQAGIDAFTETINKKIASASYTFAGTKPDDETQEEWETKQSDRLAKIKATGLTLAEAQAEMHKYMGSRRMGVATRVRRVHQLRKNWGKQ